MIKTPIMLNLTSFAGFKSTSVIQTFHSEQFYTLVKFHSQQYNR